MRRNFTNADPFATAPRASLASPMPATSRRNSTNACRHAKLESFPWLMDSLATHSSRLAGRIGVCGVYPGCVSIPENRPRGGRHETTRNEFQRAHSPACYSGCLHLRYERRCGAATRHRDPPINAFIVPIRVYALVDAEERKDIISKYHLFRSSGLPVKIQNETRLSFIVHG